MPIFVNQNPVETSLFAGGECHVCVGSINIDATCEIVARLVDANDIMQLLLTVDAVRRRNARTYISLVIPYFPYARQDRVCNAGEAFSLRVMTNLINGLRCQSVTVFDPHSEVTPALLDNCTTVTQADIISETSLGAFIIENDLTLLSPDAGAEKKALLVAKRLAESGTPVEVLFAGKQRDSSTGEIKAVHIHGDVTHKNIIIVDDICDGGRTFIEISKELRKSEVAKIYLYTTHGIYTRGLEPLRAHFDHLYCYHDMRRNRPDDTDFLTVLEHQRPAIPKRAF